MKKREPGPLEQAMDGVERLIVKHCGFLETALHMSQTFHTAPACGQIEVLEDVPADAADQIVRNISELSVALERLQGVKDRTKEYAVELPIVWEQLVIMPDEEKQELVLSAFDGPDIMRLSWREARQLGKILLAKSDRP